MNTKKERVLAYGLAKTIDNSQLTEVAGGAAQLTMHQTLRASGNGAMLPPDVIVDDHGL